MRRRPRKAPLFPYTTLFRSTSPPSSNDASPSCPPTGCCSPHLAGTGRAGRTTAATSSTPRSEEHTSELQSRQYLVCRLLLEKKKQTAHASQKPKTNIEVNRK